MHVQYTVTVLYNTISLFTNILHTVIHSALNEQYDHVRQIAYLKQDGVRWRAIHFRITNEVASLVLRILQELYIGIPIPIAIGIFNPIGVPIGSTNSYRNSYSNS